MAVLTDYIIAKRRLCSRCSDQSTCDSRDPSASSILSDFVQAFFDCVVLNQ